MVKPLDNVLVNKMSPSRREAVWLYKFIKNHDIKSVLEFGCGVTTITAMNAMTDRKRDIRYLVVEDYQPNIDMVNKVYPSVECVATWAAIPERHYDLVLVDGSSGSGLGVRNHRAEAIVYSERFTKPGAIYIIHDAHSFSGHGPIKYVTEAGYKFIELYVGKKGFAAYFRP